MSIMWPYLRPEIPLVTSRSQLCSCKFSILDKQQYLLAIRIFSLFSSWKNRRRLSNLRRIINRAYFGGSDISSLQGDHIITMPYICVICAYCRRIRQRLIVVVGAFIPCEFYWTIYYVQSSRLLILYIHPLLLQLLHLSCVVCFSFRVWKFVTFFSQSLYSDRILSLI